MKLTNLTYQVVEKSNITDEIAQVFAEHLTKQGKVTVPSVEKLKTCDKLVLCFADYALIGIGALKLNESPALKKAGLESLQDTFSFELGYFFVSETFRGLGVSTAIARLLLLDKTEENIFATTELYVNNPMMKTLEKLGFKHYGIPWKSIWHDGTIGVFLKFKKGIKTKADFD
ncbi:MAG: GNAT family N-acetyltransferase [Emticicia sp.]|uniref:GNAT family N-acetyltransferase n=1 Tax=Emticicia sp. TaxID=1930953 RepID=UPI003BA83F09